MNWTRSIGSLRGQGNFVGRGNAWRLPCGGLIRFLARMLEVEILMTPGIGSVLYNISRLSIGLSIFAGMVEDLLTMDIKRSGSQPSGKGQVEYFTGTVRIDPLFQAPDPARAVGASVTFEPGARTAWHSHPLGQTLIVTAGCGRAQRWGGPVEEIRPGDVIWFSPGEKHWHGATPTTAMTHIAIQERLDGKTADWMEKVSDEQYQS